ncbi:hypothetical protein [Dactylosporangium sp. CA-092794]|uniref:hypothetical protein n=1 Tax=Dactylosporangium sp. CA-092794 TaxID=3239929 RepID=UPI003D94D248
MRNRAIETSACVIAETYGCRPETASPLCAFTDCACLPIATSRLTAADLAAAGGLCAADVFSAPVTQRQMQVSGANSG